MMWIICPSSLPPAVCVSNSRAIIVYVNFQLSCTSETRACLLGGRSCPDCVNAIRLLHYRVASQSEPAEPAMRNVIYLPWLGWSHLAPISSDGLNEQRMRLKFWCFVSMPELRRLGVSLAPCGLSCL